MRKIVYLTGTRADFGLLESTLHKIQASDKLELSVCVTGMHLLAEYGMTVNEIRRSGLPICAEIPVDLDENTGAGMAMALANVLSGFTAVLVSEKPDLLLLLGDRGEMLAGAISALHLNIPIVHIHGGERSGTIDEPVRHAISKLSHFHFVTTSIARDRLIRMGEHEKHIYVVGAPGLDSITSLPVFDRDSLFSKLGFNPELRTAVLVFHPVVQQASKAGEQFSVVLDAICKCKLQVLILQPNADAGSLQIRAVIDEARRKTHRIQVYEHLDRTQYLGLLSTVDILVGNSSSGIIEAASLGIPVVNIGKRQQFRERNSNVVDVPEISLDRVVEAIERCLASGRGEFDNIYGSGSAGRKIVEILEDIVLDRELLHKVNTY